MEKLQQKINYKFKDIKLLKLALTHRSYSNNNNERLEFLGDSILGAIIAIELFKLFPTADEGELTRLKSYLVRGLTLAEIGKELQLSKTLKLGSGELKNGGLHRESILEDCVEAILGAIYLDSDFTTTQKITLAIYKARLSTINLETSIKDSKTMLQEFLQGQKKALPTYELLSTIGKDHNAIFKVRCKIKDYNISTTAEAKSIKRAQHSCAKILLSQLKK